MQELKEACRRHGFDLPPEALAGLQTYLALLLKWNKAMNLVGPQTWREILEELILDSFHLAGFLRELPLPPEPETWDLGAGAGLPGLPLRLLWPDGRYTLIEVREKRALFLQNAVAACGLANTTVYRGRAEHFMTEARRENRPANLLLSRAFLPWREVLALAGGNLAPCGLALCLTLEEPPPSPPSPWRLLRAHKYSPSAARPDKTRWFWAFEQTE